MADKEPGSPPAAPTNLRPNAIDPPGQSPVFEWSPVPGASEYVLYVRDVTEEPQYIVVETLTACSFTPPSPLDPERYYNYTVRARNAAGESEISGWQTVWPLAAPANLSPSSMVAKNPPSFRWTEVEAAECYQLYVRAPGQSEYPIVETVAATSFTPTEPFEDGAQLDFTVRARNRAGQSEISGWQSFAVPRAPKRKRLREWLSLGSRVSHRLTQRTSIPAQPWMEPAAAAVAARLQLERDPLPPAYREWLERLSSPDQRVSLLAHGFGALADAGQLEGSRGLVFGCRFGILTFLARAIGASAVLGVIADPAELEIASYEAGYFAVPDLDLVLAAELAGYRRDRGYDWLMYLRPETGLHSAVGALVDAIDRLAGGAIVCGTALDSQGLAVADSEILELAVGSRLEPLDAQSGAFRVRDAAKIPSSKPGQLARHRPLDTSLVAARYVDRRVEQPMRIYSKSTEPERRILPLQAYDTLLTFLTAPDSGFRVVPLCDFASASDADSILVGIRHDVDLDLGICTAMSELEGRHRVKSTYFLLHNCDAYYGRYCGAGRFYRFDQRSVYRALEENGQEVGLHIDPIGTTALHGVDGIEAMRVELEHLRDEGFAVPGVVSHNSHSVYGADNKDVFQGQNTAAAPLLETPAGWTVPLGEIALEDWGLSYCADFNCTVAYQPLDEPYVSPYGFRIDTLPVYEFCYQRSYSLVLGAHWEISADPELGGVRVPNDELLHHLSQVPAGAKLLLNIHPMFYGLRDV